jgi:TPR repeat protein
MTRASADEIVPLTPEQVTAALAAPDVQQGREAMHDPKRDSEALAHFTRAAEQGNPIAEAYLGYLSYMGHGVEQNDRTAAAWYRRASERGFADAQFRLGVMYLHGRELPEPTRRLEQNSQEAMAWIQRAANGGNPAALDFLADELQAPFSRRITGYLLGRTTADEAIPTKEETAGLHEAVQLYRRAAEQNDGYAMRAMCSLRGYLVPMPPDIPKWCEMADRHPPAWSMTSTEISINGIDLAVLSSDQIPMVPK